MTVPAVELRDWPPRHRIIVFPQQGDPGEVAERLTATGRFDPVLLRGGVGIDGQYLLLPDEQASKWDAAGLAVAQQAAEVELLPSAIHPPELAAFVVAIGGGPIVGRWAATDGDGGAVTWSAEQDETPTDCGAAAEPEAITAAIRAVLPPRFVAAIRARLAPAEIASWLGEGS